MQNPKKQRPILAIDRITEILMKKATIDYEMTLMRSGFIVCVSIFSA